MRRGWRWLPLTAVVIVLDQLSKAWLAKHFTFDESVAILPMLNVTLRFNTGAAFSVLADASGWQRWLFAALAIAVAVGIAVWLYRLDGVKQRLLAVSLSLVLAGALGNLIDRLRLGHVIDFVDVHWKDVHFPAFNVADSAITIGAILLLIDAWRTGSRGGNKSG